MKHFLLLTFLMPLLFSCTPKTEQLQDLKVTWSISVRNNEALEKLPWRLLDAIEEGKIKTYDSSLHEVSRAALKSRITLDMRDVISLTKEECDIMLANGDFSFGESLVPKQSPKQLQELYAKGKEIDSLLVLKYRPPFESKVFQLELVEKVKLDTTLRSQMGSMQYIRLILPKKYSQSGHDEIFCQVKYEDFKTLGIPEQLIIDDHTFIIDTEDSDLTIDDGKNIQHLSAIKDSTSETIQHGQIEKSIFKYFVKNIQVVEYIDNSKDAVIREMGY